MGMGPMAFPARLRTLTTAILVAAALWQVARWMDAAHTTPAVDTWQFWRVGRWLAQGLPPGFHGLDLYDAQQRSHLGAWAFEQASTPGHPLREVRAAANWKVLDTNATPFFYAVMSVTSLDRFDTSATLHAWLLLLAALASAVLLARSQDWAPDAALALWLWMALLLAPWQVDMLAGNVQSLQLLAVALGMVLMGARPGLAGLLLGSAAMFKPTIALCVPLVAASMVARRQRRRALAWALGSTAGVAVGLVVGGAALGGVAGWDAWARSLARMPGMSRYAVALGNYSWPRVLLEAGAGDVSGWLTAGGLAALVALAWVAAGRGLAAGADSHACRTQDHLAVAMGVALPLFTSHLAWSHYWVLALPLVCCVLAFPTHVPHGWLGRAGGALALVLVSDSVVPLLVGLETPAQRAPAVQLGTCVALACGAWRWLQLQRLRPPSAASKA